jgi:5-methyltetrahydropteroyltriglutamate--homocysteine methyltransferase
MTSTVGPFPRPAALRRATERHADGEIDAAALRDAEREALRMVLELQQRVGLDLLVDGALDREPLDAHLAEALGGVELSGPIRIGGSRYGHRLVIVGEVRRAAAFLVDRWREAQALARRPVKVVLTGPHSLMDRCFDQHYPTREACCMALARVIREEIKDLVAAGAREIQLDEPALGYRPDESALGAQALEIAATAVRGRARLWLRVDAPVSGSLVERLAGLPVDGVMLPLSRDVPAALRGLPEEWSLQAGVVGVGTPEDEGAARARIERILEAVPAPRLWLGPDGGLEELGPEEVEATLTGLVRLAQSF